MKYIKDKPYINHINLIIYLLKYLKVITISYDSK